MCGRGVRALSGRAPSGRTMLKGWIGGMVAGVSMALSLAAAAAESAVVFVYHEFGNPAAGAIDIDLEQFDRHIEAVRDHYRALPLPEIVAAFRRREPLPARAIALTIDSAYASAYREAWPRLRRAGIPFTVFVQTDPLDLARPGYMSWNQLRELAAAGVGVGTLGASYRRYPDAAPAERAEDMARAIRRIEEELGFRPLLFAYPYGDFGSADRAAVREAGFVAAFGQHSGVAGPAQDSYALPRFFMNRDLGSVERFRLAADAVPLPVVDVVPEETVLNGADNPPAIGFTVAPSAGPLDRLNCFASNEAAAVRLERLGSRRIELRLSRPFTPPRGRVNCTLPTADGRFHWFGQQYYVPR